jgi:hypothetical protein
VSASSTGARRAPSLFDFVLGLVAVILAAAAIVIGYLHQTQGPPAQRVNVRWAPGVSAEARAQVERARGLHSGQARERRTWNYRIRDRSRRNIERLLTDPLVEDTYHIDPKTRRVMLDRPALDPRVRTLLETDQLMTVAWALGLVAALAGWRARPAAIAVASAVAAVVAAGVRAGVRAGRVAALARARMTPRVELGVGCALGLLFLAPLLLTGPFEEEIVQATILPNQVFYRALVRGGEWLYWMNNLGFGTPMPIGDPLLFHPVFAPLVAFTSLRVTLSAVWIAHVAVIVVYVRRLAAVSGVQSPLLRIALLVCYLWSFPSVFYFYASDWVQMAISWSLYPALIFYVHQAITGGAETHFGLTAARLGALLGFWVLNAHPGYIVPLSLVLGLYVLAAAPLRRRVYLCLLTSGLLCTAMTAARIYTLLREVPLFPDTARALREGTEISAYFGAVAMPMMPLGGRGPFIGAGIAVAFVAALALTKLRDPHLRGCTIACAGAIVLNVIPPGVSNRVMPAIGNWLFGDAVYFYGLLVAAAMLAHRPDRAGWRVAAAALLCVQLLQQGVWIWWPTARRLAAVQTGLLFYRYQGQPVGLAGTFVEQAERFGPRIYLSPETDRAMRGRLSAYGVHFSSDLVLLGLNPINGWFKNVSMAAVHPPESLMESVILGDVNVIQNRVLLDVLGIDLILSTERETGIPPGLDVVARPDLGDTLRDPILLANADAWPQAVLMQPHAASMELPIHAGCRHQAALCRDYGEFARARIPAEVSLTASNGRYAVRLPAADRERLLFISALHRPEWTARSAAGPLPVHVVAGAFLGVIVPGEVTEVTVAYDPRIQIALTWFSTIVFFGTVGAIGLFAARRVDRAVAAHAGSA